MLYVDANTNLSTPRSTACSNTFFVASTLYRRATCGPTASRTASSCIAATTSRKSAASGARPRSPTPSCWRPPGSRQQRLRRHLRGGLGSLAPTNDRLTRLYGHGFLHAYVDYLIDDASFTKLREVSVTLTAPRSLAARFRAEGVRLTIAGRNLATWTDYTGFDPEVNSQPLNLFSNSDFFTIPPLRTFSTRLTVQF